MRLTQNHCQIILDAGKQHFGEGCEIWLFGSRADDSLKGGDIDLMVFPTRKEKKSYPEKLAFRSQLKCLLGDRKIDVLFAPEEKSREAVLESLERFAKL